MRMLRVPICRGPGNLAKRRVVKWGGTRVSPPLTSGKSLHPPGRHPVLPLRFCLDDQGIEGANIQHL